MQLFYIKESEGEITGDDSVLKSIRVEMVIYKIKLVED